MGSRIRYLLLPCLIVILLLAGGNFTGFDSTIAADELEGKIVYVDIQEIFANHPEKEKAETELNEMASSMQKKLEEEAADLSEEEQKQILTDYEQELAEKEQKLIQDILIDIDKTVEKIAAEKKVKMVLEKKNVLFGGYDLTQEVISYIANR